MITCSPQSAVSSFLSPYALNSKTSTAISRVIPRDPQTKHIWLQSVIETTLFKLGVPLGIPQFLSFNTATI